MRLGSKRPLEIRQLCERAAETMAARLRLRSLLAVPSLRHASGGADHLKKVATVTMRQSKHLVRLAHYLSLLMEVFFRKSDGGINRNVNL